MFRGTWYKDYATGGHTTFHFPTSSKVEHSGCASLIDGTETITAYCVVLK